ncbi:DUF6268 family outer membrane beta-barrel protein [Myroides sp. N17-2]|uniref:DUF6268 family outer membrane beta-barrel protein n=1 Tax=Myroides sp. N17-2 TaxID=2030799 RepID=UPI000EFD7E4E|nr:DUF6268 family outer membrane beta-barrel protein [Myroides sp. N17-2]
MKAIKYLVVAITLCLGILSVQGQSKFLGEFKMDYVPMSNYIRPIDSVKTDSKSDFKRAELAIEIPISTTTDHRGKPKVWSIVGYGAYARMGHKDYEEPLFPSELLNASIGVKHIRSIGDSWSLMIMGSVGVYTDMEQINKDAILGQGGVFFIKHFRPNFALGGGPVLTNSFGVPMVLPGIYINWETMGDFYVKVAFPKGVEAGYKFSEMLKLSAAIDLQGMTAIVKQDGETKLLGFQQIVAGLRPEIKFSDKMTLSLTAGTTLVRSFSFNERKIKNIFKEKKEADPKFSTTLYAAVSFKWSL